MVEISLSFFFLSLFLLLLKASRSNLAQFGGEAGRFAKNWGIVRPKSPRSLLRSIQSAKEDVLSLVHSVEGLKK